MKEEKKKRGEGKDEVLLNSLVSQAFCGFPTRFVGRGAGPWSESSLKGDVKTLVAFPAAVSGLLLWGQVAVFST